MTILSYHAQANRLQRKGRADDGSAPPPVTDRFPGDPGVGRVMTGATQGGNNPPGVTGYDYLTNQTGFTHLMVRSYYTTGITGSSTFWNRSEITGFHNDGHVPMPSFKLGGDGWAQSNAAAILNGSYDDVFTAEATWAKAQGFPMFVSFYHEPEDNWVNTTQTANYRAIWRHIVDIFKSVGATNVNWFVIWMTAFSFTPGAESSRGLEWFQWDPDWKGTRSGGNGRPNASDYYTGANQVCNLMGYDIYNPALGGQTSYHEYITPMNTAWNRQIADGKTLLPYVHPEWGTNSADASTMPSDGWTGFYTRAFQGMAANKGVGFITYEGGGNSLYSGPDHVARLAGYENALNSQTAYLQTDIP